MSKSADWPQVVLVLAAGVIAAAQIGKAAIALPLLRQDLGLDLLAASWIVGAYAALGAVGGVAAGFIASHFAMRRVIVAGLAVIAAGNVLGAFAPGAPWLIGARVLEGTGFLAVVVSGPSLLRNLGSARSQPIVFACWSAYIPVGAALMMFVGPLVMDGEWRRLWMINGLVAGLHALVLSVALRGGARQAAPAARPHHGEILALLRSRALLLLAAAFLLYAVQYYALATFLPVFLEERLGFSLAEAGTISAIVVSANALGNIAAGVFLRMGVALWRLIATVFVTVGITGFAVFSASSPVLFAAAAAGVCLGVSALLPASVFVTMPRVTATAPQLALSVGLIQQASAIGQCVGPVILAAWVLRWDWNGVPWLFAIIAALGLIVTALVRNGRIAERAPQGQPR